MEIPHSFLSISPSEMFLFFLLVVISSPSLALSHAHPVLFSLNQALLVKKLLWWLALEYWLDDSGPTEVNVKVPADFESGTELYKWGIIRLIYRPILRRVQGPKLNHIFMKSTVLYFSEFLILSVILQMTGSGTFCKI